MATTKKKSSTAKRPVKKASNNSNYDLESRIVPVSEIEDYWKCLFYGRSGTGKTTLAGSFPTPHLLLDIKDKGTKSIKSVPGIDVFSVESWTDFEEVYWYLYNNPGKYKTVTPDTVTQLQDLCMRKVKKSDEISKTSRQAWGEVGELMKAWIINYRDLPMNVNFLAQPRLDTEDNDSEELSPEMGAGVSPATQKILHAAVDVIGYTFIRESEKKKKDPVTKKVKTTTVNEYCLRIGPHPVFTTKFRSDKDLIVPEFIVDASYDKLIKLSEGRN